MANRPGVMLYFDNLRPALNRMDDAQCGALFRAIINYAEHGEISDLEQIPGMAFDMLRPLIDRDGARYIESVDQRRYAVYCREMKKKDMEPISFNEWKTGDIEPIPTDIGRYPTTIPTAATTTTPTTTATTATISTEITKKDGVAEGDTRGGDFAGNVLTGTATAEAAVAKKRDEFIEKLKEYK